MQSSLGIVGTRDAGNNRDLTISIEFLLMMHNNSKSIYKVICDSLLCWWSHHMKSEHLWLNGLGCSGDDDDDDSVQQYW